MSFFNKLFGSNTKNTSQQTASENANFAPQLETFINTLLSKDSYIARSDYTPFLRQNSTEIDYLKKLYTDRLLENYCKQNKISIPQDTDLDFWKTNFNFIFKDKSVNRLLTTKDKYSDSDIKEIIINAIYWYGLNPHTRELVNKLNHKS